MRNQLWLCVTFGGLAIHSTTITGPIFTLSEDQITYRGVLRDSVEEFYNIKFAHDTSGSQQFAPPKPYTPLPDIEIDATIPGPACPQTRASIPPFFAETPNQSEDCRELTPDSCYSYFKALQLIIALFSFLFFVLVTFPL
ncbi:hypothetical protein F4802DRAFT_589597 [Xylaria palmicola]|nr:hypothetical protein F4802DRAFT_589597 [Xylaria palmicola]